MTIQYALKLPRLPINDSMQNENLRVTCHPQLQSQLYVIIDSVWSAENNTWSYAKHTDVEDFVNLHFTRTRWLSD